MSLSFSAVIISSNPNFDTLIKKAKFKNVLVLCDNLLSKEDLSESDILFLSILKSFSLLRLPKRTPENIHKGIASAETIFRTVKENNLEQIYCDALIIYLYTKVIYNGYELDLDIEMREEFSRNLYKESKIKVEEFIKPEQLEQYLVMLDQCEKVLNTYEDSITPFGNNKRLFLFQIRDWIYGEKNEVDKIHENRLLILEEAETVQNSIEIAWSTFGLGAYFHFSKREMNKAYEYYSKALNLFIKLDSKLGIAKCNLRIGNYWFFKGYIKKAQEYYEKAKKLFKELDRKYLYYVTIGASAITYYSQGVYQRALELENESLSYYYQHNQTYNIAQSLLLISEIYFDMDQYPQVKVFLDKSYKTLKEMKSDSPFPYKFSQIHYAYIRFLIKQDSLIETESHLKELENFANERRNNKFIQLYYKLSKALILKESSRIAQLTDSQRLFKEIIEENINYPVTTLALLNLAELLLEEFKLTNDAEIIQELHDIIEKMYQFGQECCGAYFIEVLIIKSKLETLQANFNKASDFLHEAEQIITDREYNYLEKKITDEINSFQTTLKRSTFTTDDVTLRDKLEILHLKNYLSEAKKVIK